MLLWPVIRRHPDNEPEKTQHPGDQKSGTPSTEPMKEPHHKRGATAPPIAEPLSNNATAMPRSLAVNHSETALVAPGQFAASPAQPEPKSTETPLAIRQ